MCVLVPRLKVLEHLVLTVIFDRCSISLFEGAVFLGPDSWLFLSDVLVGYYFRLNFLSVLKGNVVNIQTGHWVGKQSGLGAGSDSFYEYLLKSYILFGEKEDLEMFNDAYRNIQNHLRRGYAVLYEYQ